MENVSKNKRRGRPAIYKKEGYDFVADSPAKTVRGKQNYIRASIAMHHLSQDKVMFAYLLEPRPRFTILAELGRIADINLMLAAAKKICADKMKTDKATGLIRRNRGSSSANCFTLPRAIQRTVEKHIERYRTTEKADVAAALKYVALNYQIACTFPE